MSGDIFFRREKHIFAWHQPLSVSDHIFLKDAVQAIELWMEVKIRRSPCNLHDIAECKQVITGWIDVAKTSIPRIQRMLETCESDQEERKWFENDIKKKEEYLGTLMGYLDELPQYLYETKLNLELSLAMASHPRLGEASLLSQLSSDNLRWIAEFLWD